MQHPERADGGGVTGDAVHETSAPVLLGEPVAVGHERAPPRELHLGLPRIEGDSQVVNQEIAAPPIVVPADERDRNPATQQRMELGDCPEVTAGNHGAVLEPEIEQIPVDDERVSQVRDAVEKTMERGADRRGNLSEMSVGDDDDARGERHGPKLGTSAEARKRLWHLTFRDVAWMLPAVITSITLRVNYSETDQMGVVYHANYLIWFDRARTELMRETGLSYKELEQQGVYLAVSEVSVRYRGAARYDDLVQVRCWVRELASRRVTFGYAVERAATGELLATGVTSLVSLTHQHALTRIPTHVVDLLKPIPDPVRL